MEVATREMVENNLKMAKIVVDHQSRAQLTGRVSHHSSSRLPMS